MHRWTPPESWVRITTIDAHTGGEPLRIITSGVPEPHGATILAKRDHAMQHSEELRRILMWEPRGHADMYGALLTEPVTPDGDLGVLFLHNDGFSTMCGHGIIALGVVGVATGLFPADGPETVINFDTPAGRVKAVAHAGDDGVARVSFVNVPSFVLLSDLTIDLPGVGEARCDVAYGGAFYAYVDAAHFGLSLLPSETKQIIDLGRRIKSAVSAAVDIAHPEGGDGLGFLYGTIFVGPPHAAGAHSRNVCVFADGEVDRSPTGTGVSGRLAIHHARGELGVGDTIVVESILGSTFTGRVLEETVVGEHAAIVPEVSGRAWITGRHEFLVDPTDPLKDGFLVR